MPKGWLASRRPLRAAWRCAAALLNSPRSPLPLSYSAFHSAKKVPMLGFSVGCWQWWMGVAMKCVGERVGQTPRHTKVGRSE